MKSLWVVLSLIILGSSTVSFAQYSLLGAGFNAPTIVGKSNVNTPAKGEIIFDTSDSTFYGYDGTTWAPLGSVTLANSVISNSGSERIERATIEQSGGTYSITRQSNAWISSITKNSTGDITLNLASSLFTATPTCVISNNMGVSASFNTGILESGSSSTAIRVICLNSNESGFIDQGFNIICMGPR